MAWIANEIVYGNSLFGFAKIILMFLFKNTFVIWTFHGGEDDNDDLGYNAVWTCR